MKLELGMTNVHFDSAQGTVPDTERGRSADNRMKMCPLLSINFVPSQRSKDWWEIAACKEDQCAWWDQHGKRCYIKTLSLAIASEVRSNLAVKGVEL